MQEFYDTLGPPFQIPRYRIETKVSGSIITSQLCFLMLLDFHLTMFLGNLMFFPFL
jgi:hypothetical protein